jgi:hypothetical protein
MDGIFVRLLRAFEYSVVPSSVLSGGVVDVRVEMRCRFPFTKVRACAARLVNLRFCSSSGS